MPDPLARVHGVAAALPIPNIDTDVIMPKRFLRTITRAGLAAGALADLRFHPDGSPRPDCVLNREPWQRACILVVGDNFGCGSSREHAVWGLHQLGIRALIGTSFAGIFNDNCRLNGVAAIAVAAGLRNRLLTLAADPATCTIDVDLQQQTIAAGGERWPFHLPASVRDDLLCGRDAIATTLGHAAAIDAFEAGRRL